MSLDKPDLHVHLTERVMLELKSYAEVNCIAPTRAAEEIIAEALMGKNYPLRLSATRMIKAGILGSNGE